MKIEVGKHYWTADGEVAYVGHEYKGRFYGSILRVKDDCTKYEEGEDWHHNGSTGRAKDCLGCECIVENKIEPLAHFSRSDGITEPFRILVDKLNEIIAKVNSLEKK